MSNTDAWFGPLKASCQAVCGRWDEAKKSMKNCKDSNPLVLGTRGVYHTCRGRKEKGKRLLKDGGKRTVSSVNSVVNAVPIVGHAKGVVHYACGDKQGGHKAMKSSSRTTGGMIGGVAGFVATGGVGAVGGYMAGTSAMDTVISGVDSAVHDEKRLHGNVANLDAFRKNPNVGTGFEVCTGFALDYAAGLALASAEGVSAGSDVNAGDHSSAASAQSAPDGWADCGDLGDGAGADADVGGGDDIGQSSHNASVSNDSSLFGDEVKLVHDVGKIVYDRISNKHVDDGRSFPQEIRDALPDDMKLPGKDDPALDLTPRERMDLVAHMSGKDARGMFIPNKRDFIQEIERPLRR